MSRAYSIGNSSANLSSARSTALRPGRLVSINISTIGNVVRRGLSFVLFRAGRDLAEADRRMIAVYFFIRTLNGPPLAGGCRRTLVLAGSGSVNLLAFPRPRTPLANQRAGMWSNRANPCATNFSGFACAPFGKMMRLRILFCGVMASFLLKCLVMIVRDFFHCRFRMAAVTILFRRGNRDRRRVTGLIFTSIFAEITIRHPTAGSPSRRHLAASTRPRETARPWSRRGS